MSGEIILYDELARQDAMAAIEKLGEKFAESGMFGIGKKVQGEIMAMTCLAERMTPVKFSQTYHIVEIKGVYRLSMRSDAMLAKYIESGGKVAWIETNDKIARARWTFGGSDIEISFSIEDAKRACLAEKDVWKKYPDAMLRARCISKAIRMVAPMVNSGIYTPEEVADFDESPKSAPSANRKPFPKREETEPKEAEALVVDDAPLSKTVSPESAAGNALDGDAEAIAMLSANEASVNAYLVHLKYISANQTFRDLKGIMRVKALSSPAKVIAQAKIHMESLEEKKEIA